MEFLERTEAALPGDAVVFADMCVAGYWLAGHLRVRTRASAPLPDGLGHARLRVPRRDRRRGRVPDRTAVPVVSVSGDGGMLFAIGELATAAQEGLPLTAVVVDDGGYGMLRYGHDPDEDLGTELTTPDFAAVARGLRHRRPHRGRASARPIETALADAVASGVPNLLHVRARLYPPRSTSPRWPIRGV